MNLFSIFGVPSIPGQKIPPVPNVEDEEEKRREEKKESVHSGILVERVVGHGL